MSVMTIKDLEALAVRKGVSIIRTRYPFGALIVVGHPLAVPENAKSEAEQRVAIEKFLRNCLANKLQ
jgi:hypothetical protein